ncbi:MAG: cation-transporting P-type ATPase [Pirellulaceae bacterium]|nr:cation-transporting P-type ATPase [Pirellulaceae bacterium]
MLQVSNADSERVLRELDSRLSGLSQTEVEARLKQYGLNEIARDKHQSPLMRLLSNVMNPLVILLTALGGLSYLTGDLRAAIVIAIMVVLGVVLRFVQEMRADDQFR